MFTLLGDILSLYLGGNALSNFRVFNNWYWFHLHKTFFSFSNPILTFLQKYTRWKC